VLTFAVCCHCFSFDKAVGYGLPNWGLILERDESFLFVTQTVSGVHLALHEVGPGISLRVKQLKDKANHSSCV
jgi:hypothetical protein